MPLKWKPHHFLGFPFPLSLVSTLLSWEKEKNKEKTFLGSKISFSFSSIASPLQFWPKNSHFCSLSFSLCLIFEKLSFHSFSLSNFPEKIPIFGASLSLSLYILNGGDVGIGGQSVLGVGFGVLGERTKINKLKKRAKMKAKKRNLSSQLVVSFLPLPTPHIPFALT